MSDHLPECPVAPRRGTINPSDCICDRLRACEQRVSEETEHAMMEFFHWKPSPPHDKHYFADNICAYCVGRREGLDAARDAVAAAYDDPAPMRDGMNVREEIAEMYGRKVMFEDALAAIDALKEKE